MHGIDFTMEEERRYIACGNTERLDRYVRSEVFRGLASAAVFLFLAFRFILPLWVAPAMIGYAVVLFLSLRSLCSMLKIYRGVLGKLYMALFERLNEESFSNKLAELNAHDDMCLMRLVVFPTLIFYAVLQIFFCTQVHFSILVGVSSAVLILLFTYWKVQTVLRVKRICATIYENGKTFARLQGNE